MADTAARMRFRTGRGHARPVIPSLLELVTAGRFHPELVTSQVADWEDAPRALSDPPRKLVLTREFTRPLVHIGGFC